MFKAYRICCCLVTLLLWQVSGTFHPLSSIPSSTSTVASNGVGYRRVQEFDTTSQCDSETRASILAVRGGGLGSMISDFNNYIGTSRKRAWVVLMVSILTDTASVALMKTAQEESNVRKLVMSFFGFYIGLAGFAVALKSIDVSIAYAIWAALGTAIVSVIGILFFGEPVSKEKVMCLTMILIGVVGLELIDEH